ncbi:hypothetical protein EG352_07480 [Chryseobacterium indologenes]|uniref:Uncharacterized protein n=1 Tax=Chryseobacterium indologenes TaxID=253 RepID=A0AAD0YZ96_CHRID|nr:hypothetical protein [Chryseobacterium indologenes]AZB17619.1 hypothetical protein EG352_07480 [Chryseobacterium indologenes]
MNNDVERIIMIKVAIALRLLLSRNKNYVATTDNTADIINSYEKIATNSYADIRKATVSNAFSGKKRSTMITIILIVESMGYTMIDFGKQYSKITDNDISEFEKNIKKKSSK